MMRLSLLRSRAYWVFCFFSPRITSQHLSLEMGRRSSIHTISPTANSFLSSCAWYFFERRTVFFMVGWVKRRSTRTTTVLACLSLTTTPCSVRFGIGCPLLLGVALLRGDGLDAGDVAASFTQPRRVFQLPGGTLETQIETLLLQIDDGVVHLIGAHCTDIGGFHFSHDKHPYSAMRAT